MTGTAWVDALFPHERARLFPSGYPLLLLGADEVGLGAWAGPVTVCAFMAELPWWFEGIGDSKRLGPRRCATKSKELLAHGGFRYAIRNSPSWTVDRLGARRAQEMAFEEAIDAVLGQLSEEESPPLVILDGELTLSGVKRRWHEQGVKTFCMPKADGRVPHVMAASILAKAHRDALMVKLDERFPGYTFAQSKGYGTSAHEASIRERGLTDTHRRSFVPNRALPRRTE